MYATNTMAIARSRIDEAQATATAVRRRRQVGATTRPQRATAWTDRLGVIATILATGILLASMPSMSGAPESHRAPAASPAPLAAPAPVVVPG